MAGRPAMQGCMRRRLSAKRQEALAGAFLAGARADHGAALRRAVADYVLRCPAQRARLGLQALEPGLAEARPWRAGVPPMSARALAGVARRARALPTRQ